MLNSSRDKNEGTYRSGRREKSLLNDPGPELRLGGKNEKDKLRRYFDGMSEKKNNSTEMWETNR